MLDLLTVYSTHFRLNNSSFVMLIGVFIECEKNNFNIFAISIWLKC
mgnify:CR=1 FL=1